MSVTQNGLWFRRKTGVTSVVTAPLGGITCSFESIDRMLMIDELLRVCLYYIYSSGRESKNVKTWLGGR